MQPGARLIIPVYRAGAAAAAAAPAKAAEVKPVARPEPKAAEADPKAQKADALAKEQEAKRLKKAEADKAAQDARLAAATKAADAKKLAEAKQAEAKKAAEAKAAEAKLAAEKAKLAKVEAAKSKADATAKAEAQKAAKEAKLAQAEAAKAAQAEKQAKAEEAAAAKAEKQSKVAMAEKPAEAPRPAEKAAAPAPAAPAAEDTTKVSVEADKFRWPARGRIIQGFSSGGNDGINIAVPEGTQVKAAEDGQVAYAGSELKGYGNLVLIRHPNGFVTAYAHNGELDVKRGDRSSAARRSPSPARPAMSARRSFTSSCARARRRSIRRIISPDCKARGILRRSRDTYVRGKQGDGSQERPAARFHFILGSGQASEIYLKTFRCVPTVGVVSVRGLRVAHPRLSAPMLKGPKRSSERNLPWNAALPPEAGTPMR